MSYLSLTKNRRGQTLIEALLALSVVTVSFMGITTLFARSFFYDRVTSDQLTATYLASEGIELAKNFIDYGTYSATPYGSNWGDCFSQPSGEYQLDFTMGYAPIDCSVFGRYPVGASPTPLNFDSTTHTYQYGTGSPSAFSRVITVDFFNKFGQPTTDGPEITVNSRVTWSTGPISQSVNLEDHFYNWRQ